MKTDLSSYNNSWYRPGGAFRRTLWYFTSLLFFQNHWFPFSQLKIHLLRLFGAKIGKGVMIKPSVLIKYPWLLSAGDHIWIGEGVWIDNLAPLTIGSHSCLSQGAYLLTGNHNFTLPAFDLTIAPIVLEDGVWIGARATVCPGVVCGSHSVLAVASIATKPLEPYGIYQGNPAVKIKNRIISSGTKFE